MTLQNVTRINSEITPQEHQAYQYFQSEFMKLATDLAIKNMRNYATELARLFKHINKLPAHEAESLLIAELSLTGRYDELIKYDDGDYRNLLIINLRYYPNPIARYNQLIDFRVQWVLPETYLSWFKDDLIASLFLANLIEEQFQNITKRGTVEFLSSFQSFMRNNIFQFNNSIYQKKLYKKAKSAPPNNQIQSILFNKNLFLLNQIKPKEIKWIEQKNEEQIEWAYDYLETRKLLVLQDTFFPINIDEKYEHIIASLNVLSNINNLPFETTQDKKNPEGKLWSERQSINHQFKKAWEAKKNRSKTTKSNKERSVKIYQKHYSELTQLAKANQTTVNKFVNNLVEKEIQRVKDISEFAEETVNKDDNLSETELSELDKKLIKAFVKL